MRAMQAALWLALVAAVLATGAIALRQWQQLRAARERARLLERQLAHAASFALLGQLGASAVQELAVALRSVCERARACQLLLDPPEAERAQLRRGLCELRGDAARASDMAQRLLVPLARTGHPRERLDVHQVLADAVAMLGPEARRRGSELILHAGAQPAFVLGDRGQLQLVVMQLLTNAMEAMEHAPQAVRRVLVTTHDAGGHLEVQVSDRGHGFGERGAETLFTPYYTTKEERMGLGLSVARDIVRAHDGTMGARRRAGGGAVFTVSLPRLAPAAESAGARPPASPLVRDRVVQP